MRSSVLRKLGLASQAGRAVVIGGLAAVSLAVTGAALAVPGSPVSVNSDATAAATHSATGEPSEDGDSPEATDATEAADTAESEAPDASPDTRTCPWPTSTASPTAVATASPHDNGLHCGWYKPGFRDGHHPGRGDDGLDQSSPRPHPTGAPDGEHGKSGEHHGSDDTDSTEGDSEGSGS
jgi:hypothetical protein